MPTGSGPSMLRNPAAVANAVAAARAGKVRGDRWAPPAAYAHGHWPKATFDDIFDPGMRHALVTTQDWVRALRHARSDARLSIRQTARQAGTSVNAVSEIELGARWPSLPLILRLSHVLEVEVSITNPPTEDARTRVPTSVVNTP